MAMNKPGVFIELIAQVNSNKACKWLDIDSIANAESEYHSLTAI